MKFFEVSVTKNQLRAIDDNGKKFDIEGLEIPRIQKENSDDLPPIFYDSDTEFYKLCASPYIRHAARILENGKVILR